MKKRDKAQRARLSPGTLAMLLATIIALCGCTGFMLAIAGDEMNSRAHEVGVLIEETGVQLADQEPVFGAAAQAQRPAQKSVPAPQQTAQPREGMTRSRAVSSITIAAGGTVYAPKAIREGAQTERGEYDFKPVFSGLGDALSGADLAIATLETMTAGEEKGYGNYNAPSALLDALRESGVDLLSLGTEHALDKGYEGLQITRSELTARGIAHAGLSGDEESSLIGVNGIEVAVLAYTYGLSDEGKESASPQEREAVTLLDVERMTGEIRQARADGANVVIVLAHWGTKNKQETPEELRTMAAALAEAGADIILGTHPNVVQGTERLRVTRADGLEYDAVVCYSLGSLLGDARTEENTAGMIARLRIDYDPQMRRISLGTLACLPVYIARQKDDSQYVYRVVDVENAQAVSQLSAEEQAAAQAAAQLVREVTGQSDMEDEGQG